MSFLGRLFGGSKAGEKLVDGAVSAVDKIWYTAQEKAEDAAKAKTEIMTVYMKWLESTSGSRIARRLIALMVTSPWALAHTLSMIFNAVAPFISGTEKVFQRIDGEIVEVTVLASDKWIAAADSLSANATENNALVGVVLLFYFGGPAAVDGVKGMVEKWSNKGQK
ncbi:MAG: hypothetical protein R3227_02855 [Reinekea sp.]|nr:hypothetical protein [Reinekea sp.]